MAEFTRTLIDLSSGFSLSEAAVFLRPLLLFIVGLGIYSWFIFKFYRFVARKDIFQRKIFEGHEGEPGFVRKAYHGAGYILKYLIIFPVITFFWVIVLSLILTFLSKSGDMANILLVAMALIGIIRVMSYYSEDLSKDLAKMLPFALLGVFIIDVSYFSLSDSLATLVQLPSLWKVTVYYFLFIILLEFALRILSFIFGARKKQDTEQESLPKPE